MRGSRILFFISFGGGGGGGGETGPFRVAGEILSIFLDTYA